MRGRRAGRPLEAASPLGAETVERRLRRSPVSRERAVATAALMAERRRRRRAPAGAFDAGSASGSLVAAAATLALCLAGAAASQEFADAGHLVWTAVGQTSRSEVDLWTKTSSGCACTSQDHHLQASLQQSESGPSKSIKTCACCSHPGACQCGPKVPYRCAQCGLEQQCDQMCNVTLDASQLYATSRLRYGQIKSLELRERQVCWYRLVPAPGYRIELQVYRLVDTGQLNRSRCGGGHLEWTTSGSGASSGDGSPTTITGPLRQHQHLWTLCGANERYSPPALLFSDDDFSPATLILRSGDSTRRGKLLAHFSFTPVGHEAPLGVQNVGGASVHGTDCDWLYRQSDCVTGGRYNNTCRMASPGYPGLYPPNRTCRYRVTFQSPFQPLAVKFSSVQLPAKRCRTDSVRIFVNGRLRSTLCGQETIHFTTHGPELIVEFNSGVLTSPYVFNGFAAHLNFHSADGQGQQTQQRSRESSQHRSPEKDPLIPDGAFRNVERQAHSVCDYIIRPNVTVAGSGTNGVNTRWSGFFSTLNTAWRVWPAPCSFTFPVQPGQSVQINLLAYNITGSDCTSFVEIHEGAWDVRWSSLPRQRMCSPAVKKARNSFARFTQPLLVQSHNASLSIRFRMDPVTGAEQFIEGAFAYYNEYEGYRQPGTLCDAQFDGKTSPPSGRYDHSFDSTIFWSVAGSFNCTATFTPDDGKSVTVKVTSSQMKDDGLCHTIVDRYGYHCISNQTENSNHVVLLIANVPIVCLCGDIQIFLPIVVTSNTLITARHHIADYTFGQPDNAVDFSYDFLPERRECGHVTYLDSPSGTILPTHRSHGKRSENEGFHYTDCLWIAAAKPGELWSASIFTPYKGDCSEWNVTLYRSDESWSKSKPGQVIDVLCPNAEKHAFVMPSGTNYMAIRLQAWNSHLVDYRFIWQTASLPSPDPGIQRSLSALITTSVPAAGQLDSGIRNVSSARLVGASLVHCIFFAITSYLIA